jgi:hypothetical protein
MTKFAVLSNSDKNLVVGIGKKKEKKKKDVEKKQSIAVARVWVRTKERKERKITEPKLILLVVTKKYTREKNKA